MNKKFRVFHIENSNSKNGYDKTVAELFGSYYSVIGNLDTFLIKDIKKDWGKKSHWGRYIKLP